MEDRQRPKSIPEILARLKPPLEVEAFSSITCGEENFAAMIVRWDEPSCATILAQNMSDQNAADIVDLINLLASEQVVKG